MAIDNEIQCQVMCLEAKNLLEYIQKIKICRLLFFSEIMTRRTEWCSG